MGTLCRVIVLPYSSNNVAVAVRLGDLQMSAEKVRPRDSGLEHSFPTGWATSVTSRLTNTRQLKAIVQAFGRRIFCTEPTRTQLGCGAGSGFSLPAKQHL